MKNKLGFTLLELLVVVLIIGILAAIALPQYRRSVEKAKLAEALVNIKAIEGSMQRYLLTNGYPSEYTNLKNFLDMELSGGEWGGQGEEGIYFTDNFKHYAGCQNTYCTIESIRDKNRFNIYALVSETSNNGFDHKCWTYLSDTGRYICKYLEPQGWQYIDDEY